MIECVQCTPGHIEQLKVTMREADQTELRLASGKSPSSLLDESFHISEQCFAWVEGEEVLCVFGVVPLQLNPTVGIPWLIASDAGERHGKKLVRFCKAKIDLLSKPYKRLFNVVHAENHKSIRWLQWCGFTFGEPMYIGPYSTKFLPFTKEC